MAAKDGQHAAAMEAARAAAQAAKEQAMRLAHAEAEAKLQQARARTSGRAPASALQRTRTRDGRAHRRESRMPMRVCACARRHAGGGSSRGIKACSAADDGSFLFHLNLDLKRCLQTLTRPHLDVQRELWRSATTRRLRLSLRERAKRSIYTLA
eukprot:4679048-Pleurochrysis_carterae.AAC.1